MRRYTLTCPQAKYRDGRIFCLKVNGLCGNQKFCRMDGIMKLTDSAKLCPLRRKEEDAHEGKNAELAGA